MMTITTTDLQHPMRTRRVDLGVSVWSSLPRERAVYRYSSSPLRNALRDALFRKPTSETTRAMSKTILANRSRARSLVPPIKEPRFEEWSHLRKRFFDDLDTLGGEV
jgi:hypothetical protein